MKVPECMKNPKNSGTDLQGFLVIQLDKKGYKIMGWLAMNGLWAQAKKV
jgi:hypothetical protein